MHIYFQRFGAIAILWGFLSALVLAETPAADNESFVAKIAPTPSVTPAAGMFLLARRNLPDPNFRRTLVLLLRHGETGTLGLVVNRRTSVKLSEAIPQIEGAGDRERPLFWGGPVAPHQVLFLLRDERAFDQSEHLVDDIYMSTHPKLLEKLFEDDKSERDLRVFAGYASWSPGQLAGELSRGDWHLLSIDAHIAFSMEVESLWETLIDRRDPKGIMVYSHSGHAADYASRDPSFRPDGSWTRRLSENRSRSEGKPF